MRVTNTSYAVDMQTRRCLNEWPDSPAAGWKGTFFFRKIVLGEHNLPKKERKGTMLPQAKLAFGVVNRPK